MPIALDLPPTATGQSNGSGVTYQYGFRTERVARREQPYTAKTFLASYNNEALPEYEIERLIQSANRKVQNLMPLFNQRIQEAFDKGFLPKFSENFAGVFLENMAVFALNPQYNVLSFSVTEDGEFELARVNKDRSKIDYFTLALDKSGKIVAAFNSIENRKSVFNTFGSIEQVIEQVVSSKVI